MLFFDLQLAHNLLVLQLPQGVVGLGPATLKPAVKVKLHKDRFVVRVAVQEASFLSNAYSVKNFFNTQCKLVVLWVFEKKYIK